MFHNIKLLLLLLLLVCANKLSSEMKKKLIKFVFEFCSLWIRNMDPKKMKRGL